MDHHTTDDALTPGSFVTPPVVSNQLDHQPRDFDDLNLDHDHDHQITPGLTFGSDGSDAFDARPSAPITAEIRRHSTEKAMLEATLTNLRSKLSDVEKDDWLFEGPRYSYQ